MNICDSVDKPWRSDWIWDTYLQTHPNPKYYQDLVIDELIDPLAVVREGNRNMDSSLDSQEEWETLMELEEALAGWLVQGSDWELDRHWGPSDDPYQDEEIPAVSLH